MKEKLINFYKGINYNKTMRMERGCVTRPKEWNVPIKILQ